jgi:hypothetical protein
MFDLISAWGHGQQFLEKPRITSYTSQRLGYQDIVAIRKGELPSVHLLSAYCPPPVHLPSNNVYVV